MSVPDRRRPFVPVLLAWLLPGAGHWLIGRRWPALFVAAAVLPLFVGGMALAGFENVSYARHEIYFWLHALCAVPTAVASVLTREVAITEPLPFYKVGELYTAVAGLLNLTAAADVWARCRRGDPEAAHRTPNAPLVADETAPPPAEGLPRG